MTVDHSHRGSSPLTLGSTQTALESEQLQEIAQAIELVMTQLLIIEQGEDLVAIHYMARHCWELLYVSQDLLRSHRQG